MLNTIHVRTYYLYILCRYVLTFSITFHKQGCHLGEVGGWLYSVYSLLKHSLPPRRCERFCTDYTVSEVLFITRFQFDSYSQLNFSTQVFFHISGHADFQRHKTKIRTVIIYLQVKYVFKIEISQVDTNQKLEMIYLCPAPFLRIRATSYFPNFLFIWHVMFHKQLQEMETESE